MDWTNLNFSLPPVNSISDNWDLNIYGKFEKAKRDNLDYFDAINETALFVANNTERIKQADFTTLLKKIAKNFNIEEIEILKKIDGVKNNLNKAKEQSQNTDNKEIKQEKTSTLQNAINFIKNEYPSLHVNSLTGEIMYYNENKLTCIDIETLLSDLELNNISIQPRKLFSYFYSPKHTAHINPINEIIKSLPEWDKSQPDFIAEILGFLNFPDIEVNFDLRQHYYINFLKFLVRCLQNALHETIEIPNKQFLVLKGTQHSRKTSFLRKIFDIFKKYTDEDIDFNPNDILVKKKLAWNIFILNDEFEKFNGKQLANLKIIMSKDNVKFKPSNQYAEKQFPKRANFLTSTNQNRFLTDITGNVRVIVIEITNSQSNPISEILLNNDEIFKLMWAQAYYYYLLSEKGEFNAQLNNIEIQRNELLNKRYMQYKNLDDAIKIFYPPATNCKCNYMNASELLNAIQSNPDFPKNLISGITPVSLGMRLTNMFYQKEMTDNNHQEETRLYRYKFEPNNLN